MRRYQRLSKKSSTSTGGLPQQPPKVAFWFSLFLGCYRISAIIISSIAANFATLVNRYTITSTISQSRLDLGSINFRSFTMKSIVTLVYSRVSGGKGCNRP